MCECVCGRVIDIRVTADLLPFPSLSQLLLPSCDILLYPPAAAAAASLSRSLYRCDRLPACLRVCVSCVTQ